MDQRFQLKSRTIVLSLLILTKLNLAHGLRLVLNYCNNTCEIDISIGEIYLMVKDARQPVKSVTHRYHMKKANIQLYTTGATQSTRDTLQSSFSV